MLAKCWRLRQHVGVMDNMLAKHATSMSNRPNMLRQHVGTVCPRLNQFLDFIDSHSNLITLGIKIDIYIIVKPAKALIFEKSLKCFFSKYFFRELSRTFQVPLPELLKLYEGE